MAKEVNTSSNFCRKDDENGKYKIEVKLNQNYYKYKIKILFCNSKRKPEKYTILCKNQKVFQKEYSYFDIGFNTKIKVSIKKYKAVIKKEKQVINKEPINQVSCENILDRVTGTKNNNPTVQVSKVITKPKYKKIKEKDFYITNTLSKNRALLNFANNEDGSIYSQPLRTTTGYYDCSSFVATAYKQIGNPFSQYIGNTETILQYCENNGAWVDFNNLKEGDVILYFDKGTDTFDSHYKHVTHVAMYIGGGQVFEYSGAGVNCRKRPISGYEYNSSAKAFRVLGVSHSEIENSRARIRAEEAREKAKKKARKKAKKKKEKLKDKKKHKKQNHKDK